MKSNYEEKREAQLGAYQRLAAKNESLSDSSYQYAKKMGDVIPFGQPILVGHHSEGSHRSHLKKIDNAMRKSIEADKKADYYEGKADNILNGTAISSDNPDAIELLREKLTRLEANQELMKNCNKIMKSKKLSEVEKVTLLMDLGLKESTAIEAMQPVYGRLGLPGWRLTNNNANIRTVRQRIEYLEKLETIKSSEEKINGIRLVVSSEDNRVQIFFPGIPEEEVRKELKSNGFRWAPSIGAWMRNISNHSIYIAKQILNNLKTQV